MFDAAIEGCWLCRVLRRRMTDDFNQPPTDPTKVERPAVMEQLLACYAAEGGARQVVRVDGQPVDSQLTTSLLQELHNWKRSERRIAQVLLSDKASSIYF